MNSILIIMQKKLSALTKGLFMSCCLVLCSMSLQASDKVSMTLEKQGLIKIGDALFSVLFFDIYHSHLYSRSGKYPVENAQDKLVFEIDYHKAISAADLIERTVEQWQHLNYPESRYVHYLPRLKALWPDIVAGDKLALVVLSGRSHFYFNEQYIGSVEAADFGRLFVDIWLSKNTSQPALRAKLLKHNYNDNSHNKLRG